MFHVIVWGCRCFDFDFLVVLEEDLVTTLMGVDFFFGLTNTAAVSIFALDCLDMDFCSVCTELSTFASTVARGDHSSWSR